MNGILKRKYLRYSMVSMGLCLFSNVTLASNFQNFIGINYTNPADYTFLIQKMQIKAGDYYFIPNIKFKGSVFVPDPAGINNITTTGTTNANANFSLPFGRYIQRLDKQILAGIEITEPFKSIIQYPRNAPARYSVTVSDISSVDVSPVFSFQFPGKYDKLAVGAGLDFMKVTAELNQMYPSLPTTTALFGAGRDVAITNYASDWTAGYHFGLNFHALEGTFLGLSYFSALSPTVTGSSTFTGFPSTNVSASINLPSTTTFAVTQFLSETWPVLFQTHYTQWTRLKKVIIYGESGPGGAPVVLPFNYNNTWEFDLSTQYTIKDKVVLGGIVAYDNTPTNNRDRTLGLPEVNQYTLGASLGYKVTKALTVEFDYAHLFMVKTVPIHNLNVNNAVTTNGNANVSGDILGLLFTVDV